MSSGSQLLTIYRNATKKLEPSWSCVRKAYHDELL